MEIIENLNENQMILSLVGRLDTLTAPILEEKLNDLPKDVNQLTLDLEKLDYISSAGLRVIAKAQKITDNLSGKLVIKNVNQSVMTIFNMTGFNTILTIE